jgi:4-carboxymuconolactone decarboxylase
MARKFVSERGRRAAQAMLGRDNEPIYERWAAEVDPDWAQLMSDWIWGMYSRDVLPHKTRELCAVAALTVLQRTSELKGHLRIALRFNSVEEVREVLLQMSLYGGMPVALDGMKALREVLAEANEAPAG